MFNSTKKLRDELESAQDAIIDLGHQLNSFKREIRSEVSHLQGRSMGLERNLNESREAGSVAVEQIREDISLLKSRVQMLDKWDDETRDKFTALMNYFEISFEEERRVVELEN